MGRGIVFHSTIPVRSPVGNRRENGDGLFVFDYLIVVSKGSADIPTALKDELSHANDVGEVRDIIERGKEQIAAFEVSNWNVGHTETGGYYACT
jgi:hypothetical protein